MNIHTALIGEAKMKSLKSYMRKYHLSNAQMARKIGLSYRCVYNWARGATKPRIDIAIKLEKITKGQVSVYDWA